MRRIDILIVLVLILAGLAYYSLHSFASRQETKAPAPESLESLRAQAEKGDAGAQNNLGYRYHVGQGMIQDYAEASRWYRKAAEQGDAVAQSNLGIIYGQGQGRPPDYVEAHMWFNLAASRASGDQQKQYADQREELAKWKMSPAQIAEAQRRAREWKPKTSQESKEPTRK
jgi:uncharacterized protein